MKHYICDRCAKDADDGHSLLQDKDRGVLWTHGEPPEYVPAIATPYLPLRVDLCKACIETFTAWLRDAPT